MTSAQLQKQIPENIGVFTKTGFRGRFGPFSRRLVRHILLLTHMLIPEQVPPSGNPTWSRLPGSVVAQRCSFEPEKTFHESRELAPSISQIDSLPAEEPGVDGPRVRSEKREVIATVKAGVAKRGLDLHIEQHRCGES